MALEKEILTRQFITLDDLWKSAWRMALVLDSEPPGTTWDFLLDNHVEAIPRLWELTLKDQTIFSQMHARKDSVLKYPWRLEGEDERIVHFVDEVLSSINLRAALSSLLDAVPYGFSVLEILWQISDGRLVIADLIERPPTLFAFNRLDLPQVGPLGFLPAGFTVPVDVPPFKFIVHTHQPDEGDRTGTPLLREVFWPAWFKRQTIKLWLKANEKGTGTAKVSYEQPENTIIDASTQETIAQRAQKLAEALSDGTAVSHGAAFTTEILSIARQAPPEMLEKFVDWADRQITLVFSGETLTSRGSDAGSGSRALGQVHERVAQNKTDSDARDLQLTINGQLVKPLVFLNFGPAADVPTFIIDTAFRTPAKIEAFHLQSGVVTVNEVRASLNLPPIDAGDTLVIPQLPQGLAEMKEDDDPWFLWK